MPPAPQEVRTFFTTFVTANRRRLFQVEANAKLFMQVIADHKKAQRYLLHAFVIMPDHIHLLLTPGPDVSLEKCMQWIKGGFSFQLQSKLDVWEKSFTEHRVKDAQDYENHVRYIEQNPVEERLVMQAELFRFSSARCSNRMDAAPAHLAASRRARG